MNILQLNAEKDEVCALELKQILSKLNVLSRHNMVHMYCDGSVSGAKVGCGAVIREYVEQGEPCIDEHISKRLGNFSSTTTAKLQAIYEGSLVAYLKDKDIYEFADTQSALFSLNSVDTVNDALVSHCKVIVFQLKDAGHIVQFM